MKTRYTGGAAAWSLSWTLESRFVVTYLSSVADCSSGGEKAVWCESPVNGRGGKCGKDIDSFAQIQRERYSKPAKDTVAAVNNKASKDDRHTK